MKEPGTFLGPGAAMALLSAISLVAAAFGQRAEDPKAGRDRGMYEELAKAPEKARNRLNPLANDPDAVAAGRLLFEDHCAECHGESGEGGKPGAKHRGPSLRAAEIQQATDGAVFWVLTNGVVRKGMPVWSKLPEPQRWQVVRFVKSLGAGGTARQPTAATQ